MTLRIIAGTRRGAHLATPEGLDTRPLRDRVRESLFNIVRERMPGARVLDAFAGSGAVGLEAISRGAAHATFIEPAAPACDAIRRNIAKLRFEASSRLVRGETPNALGALSPPPGGFTDIFLMPPYRSGLAWKCLESAELAPLLSTDRTPLAIAEIHIEEPLPELEGWKVVDDRKYGITRLVFLEWVAPDTP